MGGVLDSALEDEIVGDLASGLHKLHETASLIEVGTLLEDVLSPLHKHPAYGTGVEGSFAIFGDLPHLGTAHHISP